jgi:hypothetical protein
VQDVKAVRREEDGLLALLASDALELRRNDHATIIVNFSTPSHFSSIDG